MKRLQHRFKKSVFYYPLSILKWSIKDLHQMIGAICYRNHPIKNNKIVLSAFHGEQYNAQPKCISEWLINNVSEDLDIVWILSEDNQNNLFRTVKPRSLKAIYELMTACVWIDNCRKPYWLKKRKEQLYIQTWHGPVCLKVVEKDAQETLLPYYIKSAIQDSQNANYIVAESKWRKENILNSFWYKGPIIEGRFHSKSDKNEEEYTAEVRKFYNLDNDIHIVTYMPTFRRDGSMKSYLNDFEGLLHALTKKYKCQWKVIVRLHPNISKLSSQIIYNDYVLNGTDYKNADDLIIASDLVISDYSGCIFDGFYHGKKVILYAKDYDEYIGKDRELYFDINSLPAPLVRSEKDLIDVILNFDSDSYEFKRTEFVKKIGYYEADASELCGKIITDFIMKGGNKK